MRRTCFVCIYYICIFQIESFWLEKEKLGWKDVVKGNGGGKAVKVVLRGCRDAGMRRRNQNTKVGGR